MIGSSFKFSIELYLIWNVYLVIQQHSLVTEILCDGISMEIISVKHLLLLL